MTQLYISTADRDLVLIVRLLGGLQLTGQLHIVQDPWAGDVCFDQGRIVAARFAAEQGLPALEAMLLSLPDGRCTFQTGVPAGQTNLELGQKALETELQQLAQRQVELARVVPSLAAVPRASAPRDDRCVDEQVTLPRSALLTLAAIDGRRSVEAICGGREVVRTLEDLVTLVDQDLIGIAVPPRRAPPLVSLQARLTRDPSPISLLPILGYMLTLIAYGLRRAQRPLARAAAQLAASAHTVVSAASRKNPSARTDRSAPDSSLNDSSQDGTTRVRETPASASEEPRSEVRYWRRGTRRRLVQGLPVLLTFGLGILALSVLLSVSVRSRVSSPAEPSHPLEQAAAPTTLDPAPAPSATPRAVDDESASALEPTSGSKLRPVLEEEFDGAHTNWPDRPQSTAWLTESGYHLAVRRPGQFVAIGAPLVDKLRDVVVTANFRKSAGSSGGRYGLIVRDQGPDRRDGLNSIGNFYVLLVNDRGEYSIARREGDDWVDVLPWSPSDAIHPGNAANELVALAIGPQLGLAVNGTLVASVRDEALDAGAVGVYVNGDFAEVVLERFLVEVPAGGQTESASDETGR
jgi:hypothetical protein